MRVSVLETRDVLYDEKAIKVVLPGREGEICVLDFHQPFFYRLCKGRIIIDDSFTIAIRDGVAHMQSNELVIMVEK
ncbi:MAG: hypothetical protein KAS13_04305 [Candidatus Omnitrophica bacterium]|nr:hypothetical protein [Candidatus Omnitrophota bacterium]